MNTKILLNSGNYFDFADVENAQLGIEDIAHGLSMNCRYTGQCKFFYSIAEHSYHVSKNLPKELAMVGLLHDASESVMSDMVRPLKNIMPEYKAMEERIERRIAEIYGIPFPYPPQVKVADLRMYSTERLVLFANTYNKDGVHPENEPYDHVEIKGWHPETGKHMFLTRFYELTHNV